MSPVTLARRLRKQVDALDFEPPVTHVYNPLDYAWAPHRVYLERFAVAPRRVVLLGMNPGPFGMAQTGVPFGDRMLVQDWLGIREAVRRPVKEHPRRPVQGFDCPRGEVSGQRLWGWARDTFGTPSSFHRHFFVYNYCPLAFLEESGRNRTPDKLPRAEKELLFAACDEALRGLVRYLAPQWVVGVGRFATDRARAVLAEEFEVSIGTMPHPSPASPQANRGWKGLARRSLTQLGIELPSAR